MRDIKLLAFDVDGTLAIEQSEIDNVISCRLCQFEKMGIRICLASGKDYYYLQALARGMGLKSPWFIAENGGVVFLNEKHLVDSHHNIKEILCDIRKMVDTNYNEIWYQPNEVCLTIVSKASFIISKIHDNIKRQFFSIIDKLSIYTHYTQTFSSIDILPVGVDKGVGLKCIMESMKLNSNQIIVAGDGLNDLSMAQYAGLMLGVGNEIPDVEHMIRFDCPIQMTEYLCNIINSNADSQNQ